MTIKKKPTKKSVKKPIEDVVDDINKESMSDAEIRAHMDTFASVYEAAAKKGFDSASLYCYTDPKTGEVKSCGKVVANTKTPEQIAAEKVIQEYYSGVANDSTVMREFRIVADHFATKIRKNLLGLIAKQRHHFAKFCMDNGLTLDKGPLLHFVYPDQYNRLVSTIPGSKGGYGFRINNERIFIRMMYVKDERMLYIHDIKIEQDGFQSIVGGNHVIPVEKNGELI